MADLFVHFLTLWRGEWWIILGIFLMALSVGAVLRFAPLVQRWKRKRIVPPVLLLIGLGLGLWLAWSDRSIFDDAYIGFRYSKNLLEGHGLVFNIGERVEGYTNFLWTVLLAGLSYLTRVELPFIAFFLCLFCFIANLTVIWLIGRRLSAPEPEQWYLPLAVIWLAFNHDFHSYGTSGLETMFASLLVNLGVYCYLALSEYRAAAAGGSFLILATFTRPDHGLFYAFMSLVLAWDYSQQAWSARRRGEAVRPILKRGLGAGALFAAPFTLYAVYLVWKWHYYGDILPNTFYAYSAERTYWSQGFIYGSITLLLRHLYILLPLFFWWLATGRDPFGRRFKRFAALAVLFYPIYVIKIGGDKMAGRFFITLLPLLLLGIEQLAHRLARRGARRPAWAAVVVVALVGMTCRGLTWTKNDSAVWLVADPSLIFAMHTLDPLSLGMRHGHGNRVDWPQLLKIHLKDKGIEPTISTGGLGIISFYSELPTIDELGLTDRHVAHQKLGKRGRIGHEKRATTAYLDYRGVRLRRGADRYKKFPYARLRIGKKWMTDLTIYRYDAKLMDQIKKQAPDVHFTRIPAYLDRETAKLIAKSPLDVAKTLIEFDHYYFTLNPDLRRRMPFVKRFIRLYDFEDRRYPERTQADGAFEDAFVSPAGDGAFTITGYQGETVIASSKEGKGKVVFPPFLIRGEILGFLLGGGKGVKEIEARLVIDGKAVLRAGGKGNDSLRHVNWNVSQYRGKQATLMLIDRSPTARLLFDMLYEAREQTPAAGTPATVTPSAATGTGRASPPTIKPSRSMEKEE